MNIPLTQTAGQARGGPKMFPQVFGHRDAHSLNTRSPTHPHFRPQPVGRRGRRECNHFYTKDSRKATWQSDAQWLVLPRQNSDYTWQYGLTTDRVRAYSSDHSSWAVVEVGLPALHVLQLHPLFLHHHLRLKFLTHLCNQFTPAASALCMYVASTSHQLVRLQKIFLMGAIATWKLSKTASGG